MSSTITQIAGDYKVDAFVAEVRDQVDLPGTEGQVSDDEIFDAAEAITKRVERNLILPPSSVAKWKRCIAAEIAVNHCN